MSYEPKPQAELSQIAFCNYVIYMPTIQRIKFGITGRLPARLKEIGRIAARRGESCMQWRAAECLPGVARIVEGEIRKDRRCWKVRGHTEWLIGGDLDFETIFEKTVLMQSQIGEILGVGRA